MTKEDFLYALQNSLCDLPPEDVDQSLEYYMEMIDDCIEDGMTEEEAVAQLGSLSEIAERIRLDMPLPTLVRVRTGSRPLKAWEIVLLVLGSPVWLPILLSVFVILLSVYIVVWAVLISLYIVAFLLSSRFSARSDCRSGHCIKRTSCTERSCSAGASSAPHCQSCCSSRRKD